MTRRDPELDDDEPGEPPPEWFANEVGALMPRLQRYAARLTRDRANADDLVQDTIVRSLDKAHLFTRGTNLRAWLFTIMHSVWVNGGRSVKRRGMHVPLDDVEPPGVFPHIDGALRRSDLDRAIGKLSREMKQALLLVGLDGLRLDEVARVIGAPVGTVRSRLSRAREAVAEGLDEPTLRRKRPGGGPVAR